MGGPLDVMQMLDYINKEIPRQKGETERSIQLIQSVGSPNEYVLKTTISYDRGDDTSVSVVLYKSDFVNTNIRQVIIGRLLKERLK